MKVILVKNIKNLGQAGEIKEVSDGYARNYLIPLVLAKILTKHSLNVLQAQQKKRQRLAQEKVKEKKTAAKKIDGQSFELAVKADSKGSLYAGLGAEQISRQLEKQGWVVEVGEIVFSQAIKKLGEYNIELNLAGEKVLIKFRVIRQKND